MSKHILVTGGNSGIGLALCKILIRDHSCHVYLGSRDVSRGIAALETILKELPDKANRIEMVQIDVGNDKSCASAAQILEVILKLSQCNERVVFNMRCFCASF